jgi:hypothetical protein
LCEKEERKEFALTEKTILAGKKKEKGHATRKKNSSLFFLSFVLSFFLVIKRGIIIL